MGDKEIELVGPVYAYPPAHIDREAWTAEWIYPENKCNLPRCSKCGKQSPDNFLNFCGYCGAPMTDEAVEMVMERLEALYGKTD